MAQNFTLAKRVGASARRRFASRNWPIEVLSLAAGLFAAFYFRPAGALASITIIWGAMAAAQFLAPLVLPPSVDWFSWPPRAARTATPEAQIVSAITARLAWAIVWRTFWGYLLFATPIDLYLGWLGLAPAEFRSAIVAASAANILIGIFALLAAANAALKLSFLGYRFALVPDDTRRRP